MTTTLPIVYWRVPQSPPLNVLVKIEWCWTRHTVTYSHHPSTYAQVFFSILTAPQSLVALSHPLIPYKYFPEAASNVKKKKQPNNGESSKLTNLNTNFSHFICNEGVFYLAVKCFMAEVVSNPDSAYCSLQNDTSPQTVSWCFLFYYQISNNSWK